MNKLKPNKSEDKEAFDLGEIIREHINPTQGFKYWYILAPDGTRVILKRMKNDGPPEKSYSLYGTEDGLGISAPYYVDGNQQILQFKTNEGASQYLREQASEAEQEQKTKYEKKLERKREITKRISEIQDQCQEAHGVNTSSMEEVASKSDYSPEWYHVYHDPASGKIFYLSPDSVLLECPNRETALELMSLEVEEANF